MKTRIVHNRLGKYNMLRPSEKSESYFLFFSPERVVTFEYNEDGAPEIETNGITPMELIDELEGYDSLKFIFSSAHNHIGEKSHEERIEIARQWAKENAFEDNMAIAEKLEVEARKLEEQATAYRKEAEYWRAETATTAETK